MSSSSERPHPGHSEYSAQERLEARAARRARRLPERYVEPRHVEARVDEVQRAKPAVRPRRLRRVRFDGNRWLTLWRGLLWIGAGALALFFLITISLVYADYRWLETQVHDKEEQRAIFKKQQEIGHRRLAALTSPKGREQLLVERVYIKPGDRILLFPATPQEREAAAVPKNDLAPRLHAIGDANASAWQRAGGVLSRWWQSLR